MSLQDKLYEHYYLDTQSAKSWLYACREHGPKEGSTLTFSIWGWDGDNEVFTDDELEQLQEEWLKTTRLRRAAYPQQQAP